MEPQKVNNTKQTFWVSIGSLISYCFIMLASMLLSRYFTKGDYGTYKQVMYVYATLLVVFSVGLPRAYGYFLPRVAIGEVKSIINKITYLFLGLGILFSALLYFGAPLISIILKNNELNQALKVFALVPIFMLPTMGVEGVLSTFKKSKHIAIYKGLSSFFQLICTCFPVLFFNGTYITALLGFTISSFFIFLVALYLKNLPIRGIKSEKTSVTYKAIFSFSIPLLFASLWGMIMSSADQFFISNYFGKEVFAEFSNGWIDLPLVSMLVGATSVVLLPVFSRIISENENSHNQIRPIWNSVFEKTIILIYPILLYCIVFSDEIMILLYGGNYANSGTYFKMKLFVNFFNLIAFSPLMLALGATKYYGKVVAYGAIITIILNFIILNFIKSPYIVAIISVLTSIGVVLFWLKYIATYLKTSLINLFPMKLIYKIIFTAIPILIILYYSLVHYFKLANLYILVFSFLIYCLLFLLISLKINIDYSSIIKSILKTNNEK